MGTHALAFALGGAVTFLVTVIFAACVAGSRADDDAAALYAAQREPFDESVQPPDPYTFRFVHPYPYRESPTVSYNDNITFTDAPRN